MHLLSAMNELNYEEIKNKFKVIEDEPTVSLFVETDIEAENIWREYMNILNKGTPEEKRRNLRNFFRSSREVFYSYVINSYQNVIEDLGIPYEEPFYYVQRRTLHNVYDYTGLKRP